MVVLGQKAWTFNISSFLKQLKNIKNTNLQFLFKNIQIDKNCQNHENSQITLL